MNNVFDIGIIGLGIAGAFAALKIAKEHKNMKVISYELGAAPQKRKRQIDGWLGVLPSSDGKLYLNNLNDVSAVIGEEKTSFAEQWFKNYSSNILEFKVIQDRSPSISMEKKIKKAEFNLKLNNHIQLFPKDIHMLSKHIASSIIKSNNINMDFDNEVNQITKEKNSFTILSASGRKTECKRIIICTGRSGWRWTKDLYASLGIIENNDYAKFGIRIEASSLTMKDFNKSNCSLSKGDLELSPMCWGGTVIPEDHGDLATAFRGNENRWKSDKVSFNLMGTRFFEGNGFEQTNRIGQLTFVLANERIVKEKLSTIISKKSKISIIPEYDWLTSALNDISKFMPDIVSKGYFHVPTILPLIPKIKINNNLETNVEGMYAAGEAAGIVGILSAITTGITAAESATN